LTLDHVKRGGSGNGGGASFGVYWGNYASDAAPLPDGRVLVSWAPDIHQDYGLYIVSADGTGLERVYDAAGTSELRAKVILPRQAGATTQDMYKDRPWVARPWPQPPAGSDYARDGTFTFNALNVYFNAPVDTDIISAPAVGSAGSIRFFIDHQRKSPGSFGHIDWPVLLNERAVAADGSVTEPNAPANVPLFEQVRSKPGHGYRVPRTGGPYPLGSAHVTGMNYAPAGAVVSCVGCHAGHSMIPLPATAEGAKWTNLAPGAAVTVSSARDPNFTGGLIDRRVMKGEIWRYWNSAPDQPQDGQWAALTFSAPVAVRTVRLYNPRTGDEANSTLRVLRATVRLYADAGATLEVASVSVQPAGGLSVSGTDVSFADVRARVVKVTLDDIEGTFYGMRVASLAEVEVIGKGVE
jgi:hypothetical protein